LRGSIYLFLDIYYLFCLQVVPTWELAERWEVAREKAGGLVPTDWHSDDDARRCVQWLNHDEYT
jgi:hypothetical protein